VVRDSSFQVIDLTEVFRRLTLYRVHQGCTNVRHARAAYWRTSWRTRNQCGGISSNGRLVEGISAQAVGG
jgi:hypothetical protein